MTKLFSKKSKFQLENSDQNFWSHKISIFDKNWDLEFFNLKRKILAKKFNNNEKGNKNVKDFKKIAKKILKIWTKIETKLERKCHKFEIHNFKKAEKMSKKIVKKYVKNF